MTVENHIIKEYATHLFAELSEEQRYDFVKIFADEGTIARMESDIIAHDPDSKRYKNFKEFMKEMENEIDA